MENKFIRVEEVAKELDVSKPYAYKIIRQLNEELKAKGFITIAGRVNRQYFNERLYGAERTKKTIRGMWLRSTRTGQENESKSVNEGLVPAGKHWNGSRSSSSKVPGPGHDI